MYPRFFSLGIYNPEKTWGSFAIAATVSEMTVLWSYLTVFKEPWYQSEQVTHLNMECHFFITIVTYLFIRISTLDLLG